MPRLYIANATKQVQDFIYRLPENSGPVRQMIEIGSQVMLSGELNQLQIDAVLEQHSKYGLVRSDEIDRTKPFAGLCYSIDKPVQLPQIAKLMEHNVEVLHQRGKEIRQAAALAVNSQLEGQLADGATLQSTEMSVTEDTPGSTRSGLDDDLGPRAPVAEGVRVSRDPERAEPPKQSRRRGR